ncbi:MAG: LTA synthase family protein [Anaerovoracaceae bacterium]
MRALRDKPTRKIVLTLVLVACLIFVISQRASLYKNVYGGIPDVPAASARQISIRGNHTIIQPFRATEDRISMVGLYFTNPDRASDKGKVMVTLEDKDHKKVAGAALKTSLLSHNAVTLFSFNGDTEALNSSHIVASEKGASSSIGVPLDKDEKYFLIVKARNVASDEDIALTISDVSVNGGPGITVDGKQISSQYLRTTVYYKEFNTNLFSLFVAGILFAIILILLPWGRLQDAVNRRRRAKGKRELELAAIPLRIMFFLTPFVCYFIISKIADETTSEFFESLRTVDGWLNMLIIGLVWWLAYTCCNRVKYTIIITCGISLFFAITNYVLILFRDSPLVANDIANAGTGFAVAGSYEVVFNKAALWAIVITAIWVALTLRMKSIKGLPKKKRLISISILIIWCLVFNYVFFQSSIISDNKIRISGFKPKATYTEHGYALSFVVTLTTSIVKKPGGYSEKAVAKAVSDYKSDKIVKATRATRKTPNIIVVMNESYSDLRECGDFDTNRDYMPFYHSLKKNTIKGTLHTSIFGGSTADTEFEFLTGNSMKYLPFHSIPYNNMVKERTPSLTYALKARGYGGDIAFHPGLKTSYNRNVAYPNMGFTDFISLEDLDDPDKLRDYVSDDQDYRIVEDEYSKYRRSGRSAPFYMFNVTIQNHAGYKKQTGIVDAGIRITDTDKDYEEAAQFLNLMKKSDDALRGLIDYFSKVDEPTVIVLFGDHQPRVEGAFYSAVFGKKTTELTEDEAEQRFRTPFMIWANYDIKEKQDVNISANFLSAYLMQQTGGQMTGYDKYLMDIYKKTPVVDAMCYIDKNGRRYDANAKSKYSKKLQQYEMVQYNGLLDTGHRLNKFFFLQK